MKLPMESWLDDQSLPLESETAWREAFVCYKATANRAALLSSWAGWNLALRHRLLSAIKPTTIKQSTWDDLLRALRADDTWEGKAFEATQRQEQAVRYFDISDQLRREIVYWRDRRNDCAHYKDNEILAAHVEAFWAFVRSNLPKMVVPGSADDLRMRIVQHFDPNFTPPTADIKPLIDEIPRVVGRNEIPSFLDELCQLIPRPLTQSLFNAGSRAKREIELLTACMVHGTDAVKLAARDMLSGSAKDAAEAMRRDRRAIPAFDGKPEVVRAIWRSELFSGGHQDLEIVAALVAHELIPEDQLAELNSTVVAKLNNDIPSDAAFPTLKRSGLMKALRKYAFDDGKIDKFDWGNRNADLIAWLVASYLPADNVVRAICNHFASEPYPRDVHARLAEFFGANPDKRGEFVAKAYQLDSTPPASLVGKTTDPRISPAAEE